MKKIDTKPFGEQANEQANKSAKMKINHLNPGASATNSSLSQWCNFDGATIWQLQNAMKSTAAPKPTIAKWALCDVNWVNFNTVFMAGNHLIMIISAFAFFASLVRRIVLKWTTVLWDYELSSQYFKFTYQVKLLAAQIYHLKSACNSGLYANLT